MPRVALTRTLLLAAAAALAAALRLAALDPHVDPTRVPAGCGACHAGHGASRSPMLPAPQQQVCLRCHDSQTRLSQEVLRGAVSSDARPPLLSAVLSQPSVHPVSAQAFSREEPGAVTCTSCHSPHRASPQFTAGSAPPGQRKLSPRTPDRFEFQLCESCHGSGNGQTLVDIGRLTDANNRSYHPVEAPALDPSPSILPALAGREINCTDCHGNSAGGPRGPHGSAVPALLRASYTTTDGSEESREVYGLCYNCHDRTRVLESSTFPEHRTHIVEERAACSTCHNPHGSVENRALIRFGERSLVPGVTASGSTGRLAFVSNGPGSGTCYLTCHGVDHGPEGYGGGEGLNPMTVPDRLPGLRGIPQEPAAPTAPPSPPRRRLDRPPPAPVP